jgi:adenylate kinase family enzyme
VHRVLVAGITGSGKTTFARELAVRAGLPFHEMDALYHGPGWVPLESFVDDVERISREDSWVFDSHGYEQVRDLVWSRADTVVWLSYPRVVVMSRVLRRSFGRAWKGDEIFNGNTETFSDWLDPEHPVQWAWTKYGARRDDIRARFADPDYAHLRKVRLTGPYDARRWLDVVLPPID